MKLLASQSNLGVVGPVASIPPYRVSPNEEYMNEQQEKHFLTVLHAWKRQLMEDVDKTVSHLKDDAENYADLNDRATQEEEFNLELRTRDRERKLLKKIDETIVLIENGDFGYCEACGVEIGLPRLEVRPTATQCIDCKTVEEIREKQLTL
ncbi:MAG: RNA polymerase-binding protein DksA [Gammaproteobacteria bacterium]|nr:RNA polymerase-binding protein DksA [Gammaproteobacteria bacterium]